MRSKPTYRPSGDGQRLCIFWDRIRLGRMAAGNDLEVIRGNAGIEISW
jgi:hypothetical protein